MTKDLTERMHDPREIKQHLDHIECLEFAWYGDPPVNMTVECTKCGCVVQELYDAGWEDEDDHDEVHQGTGLPGDAEH